jgi:hypothetical protein
VTPFIIFIVNFFCSLWVGYYPSVKCGVSQKTESQTGPDENIKTSSTCIWWSLYKMGCMQEMQGTSPRGLCDQSHKPADSGNFFRLDSAHQ